MLLFGNEHMMSYTSPQSTRTSSKPRCLRFFIVVDSNTFAKMRIDVHDNDRWWKLFGTAQTIGDPCVEAPFRFIQQQTRLASVHHKMETHV